MYHLLVKDKEWDLYPLYTILTTSLQEKSAFVDWSKYRVV
jgi:hypothetical protein